MVSRKLTEVSVWFGALIVVCVVVGAVCLARVSLDFLPAVSLGVVALVVVTVALVSPYFRIVAFVGGAMMVMQSDTGALASAKPLYLAFLLTCAVAGVLNAHKLMTPIRKAMRPAFGGAAILLVFATAVAIGSVLAGEDPSRVIRDATTYIMVAAAPFIGADASRVATLRRARGATALFALVTAAGFATHWLSARGVGTLSIDRIVMPSMLLPAFGFCIGIAYGLSRKNLFWLATAAACLIAILVTGARTGLVLLVGLLGVVGSRKRGLVPMPRVILGVGVLAGTLYWALPAIASSVTAAGFFDSRLSALTEVFAGGVSSDQSGVLRSRSLAYTLDAWNNTPLFGVGFGHSFPNPSPLLPPSDFQLDSPALILAKFGILGAPVLVGAVAMMFYSVLRFRRGNEERVQEQAAARSFALIVAAVGFLGLPFEDKGFALSLALMFLLVCTSVSGLLDARRVSAVAGDGDWAPMSDGQVSDFVAPVASVEAPFALARTRQ